MNSDAVPLGLALIALLMNPASIAAQDTAPLRLVQTIPLEHVEGRIDHLAVDLKGQRLFVAALGNNTVEVVDLKSGKPSRTLAGFHEPQGVCFLPHLNRLVVTNGGDGTCLILDGDSLKILQRISVGEDADNIRYDDETPSIYVGYGQAIGIIDATSGQVSATIALQAHPESFQLERSGPRIFVNVPDAGQVAIIDRAQRRVMTTWSTKLLRANFPMALDEQHHRLFVGCRRPAKLLVVDAESGVVVTTLESVGDVDDIFYNAQRKQLYLSGGEGALQIIEQRSANEYHTLAKLPTAPGARTSILVPEWNQLLVAVPHRGNRPAEIRVYALQS